MKLVADESVDFGIIAILRKNGFEVISILESYPSEPDDKVLEIAVKERSILLTEDKDFGELVIRLKKKNYGIVLLRLSGIKSKDKADIVLNALKNYFDKMNNAFTVIDAKKIRIRNSIL